MLPAFVIIPRCCFSPELDSQGVVLVLTAIQEHFGVVIPDDEFDTEYFATFGTLVDFVSSKCA